MKCVICGKEFERRSGSQICCSYECKRIRINQRRRENKASHGWEKPRKCRICGNEFIPHRFNQVYCSPECSDWHRAEYDRKRQKKIKEKQVPHEIVAIGYAERQMAASLAKAGKIRTEL